MAERTTDYPTDEVLSKFDDYLEVNDIYSHDSRIRAKRSLRYLGQFMTLENPNREEVSAYVKYAKRKGNTNKTIENHLAVLVHYNRMLENEIWVPKQRKEYIGQQYVATKEDLTKILRYTMSVPEKEYAHLLTSIFLVASTSGMRVGELARTNVEDVRDDGIAIHAEKRERNRIVGVPPEVLEYVQDYIQNYRLKPTDRGDKGLFVWYFRKARGETVIRRYSKDSLRNLIREKANVAGAQGVNSHSLRRFAATELFRQGADLRRIQFHLGHISPNSTMPYIRIVDEEEARRNADLLRPFFREIIAEEVNLFAGIGKREFAVNLPPKSGTKPISGEHNLFSNPEAEGEEFNLSIESAGGVNTNFDEIHTSCEQANENVKLLQIGYELSHDKNRKEVKRGAQDCAGEPNTTRGEGVEPSLS